MPLLTKEPWFGPKRLVGWGWTPVSWQGWLTTAVFVVVLVAIVGLTPPGSLTEFIAVVVCVAALVAVAALTGTPPGGSSSR